MQVVHGDVQHGAGRHIVAHHLRRQMTDEGALPSLLLLFVFNATQMRPAVAVGTGAVMGMSRGHPMPRLDLRSCAATRACP